MSLAELTTEKTAHDNELYFVPEGSIWPFVGCVALFSGLYGSALALNGLAIGKALMLIGVVMLFFMIVGWSRNVIRESEAGSYNDQVDRSFRWGMGWFIFSEVAFFGVLFGALFFVRIWGITWLSGSGHGVMTGSMIWPEFDGTWPTNGPTGVGGHFEAMEAWGLPAINTLLLLSSGVTLTWAHWGLKLGKRWQLLAGLMATVALGITFLFFQAAEYMHAYAEMNLTLHSGIYGSLFYMMTGFHGMHVLLGAIILSVVLGRSFAGHFDDHHHFAFEAAAWYWHFVDVVWLLLFVTIYIL